MKAIERLKEYIDFKGSNNSLFEKEIGMSNGYIGTQLKRKADLGEGVILKILENCLDINLEWLITGKGNMIKKAVSSDENSHQIVDLVSEVFRLGAENSQLKETNELLRFKINVLEERIPADQYKDREQNAYRNVAEPQSELKKQKKDKPNK